MRAVVIGAGATGLSAAYLLSLNGVEVTLVEASPEAGGLLATFDAGGGARLERFYHHFFTHDAEIHWLLDELGLRDRVRYQPTTMGLYRGGVIHPFNGPRDILRLGCLPMADRVRFGLSAAMLAMLPGYSEREDEPALDWFERWAGHAATEAIWAPMMRVKFGDAAGSIPLAWMAGRLRQRARSRTGATEKLGYLTGSLQVLVDRLVQVLGERGVAIRLGTRVEALETGDRGVHGVRIAGEHVPADAVVSTIPTPVLARLVAGPDPRYAEALERIEYLNAICTVFALRQRLSPVYWLNVADPGYDFGGIIEQTNFVPAALYGGRHIVYLSRYLPDSHELWRMSDDALIDRQIPQVERITGARLTGQIDGRWVFRGRYAAPLCEAGFARRIPAYRTPIANLYAASMCHVYPDERSVNNSIRIAAGTVRAMGLDASMVPRGLSLAGKYGGDAGRTTSG